MAKVTGVPRSVRPVKIWRKQKKHQRRQQIRPNTRMNSEVPWGPTVTSKFVFSFLDDLVYLF